MSGDLKVSVTVSAWKSLVLTTCITASWAKMCFIPVNKKKSIVTTQKLTYERVSEVVKCHLRCTRMKCVAVFLFKTLIYDL